MRVLTLYEPWASLVVAGEKRYETRSWQTRYRGTLLIHASTNARAVKDTIYREPFASVILEHPEMSPFHLGTILGVAQLVGVHDCSPYLRQGLTDQERAFGDFSAGRYAWQVSSPVRFREPIPCRGHQGLWSPPQDLMAEIQRQMRASA